jgi:hypothetical protein
MFKPGDVVFFSEARRSSRKKSEGVRTPGSFFGVLLGMVPRMMPDPPASHLMCLMGSAGFLSFDDVFEFLGPEQSGKLLSFWQRKYYGQEFPLADAKATEHDGLTKTQVSPLVPDAGN